MGEYAEVFVGLDVAKAKHAVAVANDGRTGEVRYFGEIATDPASVRRMVTKLEKPGHRYISATRLDRLDMACIGS